MKKFSLILIILTTFVLFGCSKRVALTVNEFKEKIEKENYTYVEVTDQFKEYDYVKGAYLGVSHDVNYQIEFYTFGDEKGAKEFYKLNKEIFESSADNNHLYTNVDSKNYSKYTLTTEDKYKSITRIDNTVVYSDCDKTYKKDVEKLIKKLGY